MPRRENLSGNRHGGGSFGCVSPLAREVEGSPNIVGWTIRSNGEWSESSYARSFRAGNLTPGNESQRKRYSIRNERNRVTIGEQFLEPV